jgi:hypothetical protein
MTLVVTVVSWILYVANERKINSLSGNFLTKILCITWLENVLQVLALATWHFLAL